MDQAAAIATTLAKQLDFSTELIKQLKTELRESRAYSVSLIQQLRESWALNEQLQQQQQQVQQQKDIINELLADAAEKYADTGANDDYIVMMALQRKYDSM